MRKLFRNERASGILMIVAMLAALITANSPLKGLYDAVHHTPIHFRMGPLIFDEPLVQWINEGLMALFFLVVGLEIKRQYLEGHLSSAKQAALPAVAAVGGMIVPAAVYLAAVGSDPMLVRGWAIPTATDIVLALGILALLGSRVPAALKVFLTALAIFDDIGAVLIIGLFYGEDASIVSLALALVPISLLIALNRFGVARAWPYVLVGMVLWAVMAKSGVEPSLTGILVALAVPLHVQNCKCLSPLRTLEQRLHPWTAMGVIPLFAFFNAGIPIDLSLAVPRESTVMLAIVLGLLVGKPIGVMVFAWAAVFGGIAALPDGIDWRRLSGVALLTGVGFTMSLFIASLAFEDAVISNATKLAILAGSLASGVLGAAILSIALTSGGKRDAAAHRKAGIQRTGTFTKI